MPFHFDTDFLKRNWYYFAAAIVGLFVIYELAKSSGGGGGSASSDSGMVGASGQPISQLQAGADIAASSNNAQIQIASFNAQVASNNIAAELQASQTKTAADLALGLAQTSASKAVAITQSNNDVQKTFLNDQALVDTQSIVTSGQVQQTAIVGKTITTLAATQADVQKAMIAQVGKQIGTIQQYSKHASQDYTAFAPIAAIELGEQGAASSASAANAADRTAAAGVKGTAIKAGGSLLNNLVTGLLGGS